MIRAILQGYHFMPTEGELISILMAFLQCRAQGKQFPSSPVAEKILYGDNATPWKIFDEDDAWESVETDYVKKGTKDVVFVLTQLSAMSAKKKTRTAGSGTWDGQTGMKEIENGKGEIIGSRKMLSYRVKEGSDSDSQSDKAQWRMHEFALAGLSLKEMKSKHINIDDYVICKITRDYSRCESSTDDDILRKRKSEVAPKTSTPENKKLRRLLELASFEAQYSQRNEQQEADSNFHHWRVIEAYPQWAAESINSSPYTPFQEERKVNTSYQPSAAAEESQAINSYPPSATEASPEYSTAAGEEIAGAEAGTKSSPAAVEEETAGAETGTKSNPAAVEEEPAGAEKSNPAAVEEETAGAETGTKSNPAAVGEETAGAEAGTKSNPEAGVDYDMDWFSSLCEFDRELTRFAVDYGDALICCLSKLSWMLLLWCIAEVLEDLDDDDPLQE